MKRTLQLILLPLILGTAALAAATSPETQATRAHGWLSWRGPQQNGSSLETGLPDKIRIGGKNQLWAADFPGQSTPVIANGKVYVMGYLGDGPDMQEGVACFDAETGEKQWQQLYNDFLSDTIYLRYATSSPAIDAETGNVYMQDTQGIFGCFTADGKPVWQHDLMEEFGRLTFPNSRTASPLIDRDLVITRGITANWGAQGPAADRFYAYDKKTGDLAWVSSPGDKPKDNSFSHPVLGWLNGKRVFYAACGDGSIVCVNTRTGAPLWRVPLFTSGINASLVVHNNDKIIAIFGTPYEKGETIAIKIPTVEPANPAAGPVVIDPATVRLWTNEASTSVSSLALNKDRVYLVTETGELCAIDANTGKTAWKLKVGIEQRTSTPLFADGKIYVPVLNEPGESGGDDSGAGSKGAFYIIQPGKTEGKILCHVALEGRCFGSPTAYNGKIYVQTTKKLYCFGTKGNNPNLPAEPAAEKWPAPGPKKQLQIIPAEVLLKPGENIPLHIRALDANGFTVEESVDPKSIKWEPFIPATAKVKSTMKASVNDAGQLVATSDPAPSAGMMQASLGELHGYLRGRILPNLPLKEDFEEFKLTETNATEGASFAYPPLSWIGARFKFEVRERDGNKALTKTIDNRFFQRAQVFIGHPDMKNYTIEADVLSDGNKRKMSDVGVINQRYAILLKGNEQKLEVNSNLERLHLAVPFKWTPNEWYHLKTRVDIAVNGAGMIRAKAWKRGEAEPSAWTIEVPHRTAHRNGSPGLFGFAPQDMRVYIDNITVKSND
ncbi:MAG: PQQ-binding-like beta-propeller repeat protein [Methylacidiphilales bacterium]|nr:PQQ-binding-like beta-propeller repeat protein [Candidatus Methylacidiphilales bacterium]